MKNKVKLLWKYLFSKEYMPRYSRLSGDLQSYEAQLSKRIDEVKATGVPWAEKAKELLDQTRKFLTENKIDEGWKSLHTAMRLEIYGMNDAERIALANTLRNHASGLGEYNKAAILNIVGEKKEDAPKALDAAVLDQAVRIKDQYYNDQYYQNRLLRNFFKLLFILLFLCVAGIITYFVALAGSYKNHNVDSLDLNWLIVGVFLFSLLGAVTSAILLTRNIPSSSRRVEIGSNKMVVFSKISIGIAFSIFIFALLRTSFIGSLKLFAFEIDKPFDYFTIAFVTGFTERLANKAINKIVGEEEPTEKKG
ncbi:MAG: hypothetical protein IH597_16215 [Bacteroidales bacterium]|nr:hypothetical protein [Bacteroidales bacterium]